MTSSLFLMAKLTKLVSIRILNGGPSCVLYLKNSADEYWGASVTFTVCGSSFFGLFGGKRSLSCSLGSRRLIIRFICANF
uniref:Putative secreted protein n=1 Tax=Ixodes ricinus TaxID=34613 RepID=A0A6B0U4G1_IXORI